MNMESNSTRMVEQWILDQDFLGPGLNQEQDRGAHVEEMICMRCTGRGRTFKPRVSEMRLPKQVRLENIQAICGGDDSDEAAVTNRGNMESPPCERPRPKGRAQALRDRMTRISTRRPGRGQSPGSQSMRSSMTADCSDSMSTTGLSGATSQGQSLQAQPSQETSYLGQTSQGTNRSTASATDSHRPAFSSVSSMFPGVKKRSSSPGSVKGHTSKKSSARTSSQLGNKTLVKQISGLLEGDSCLEDRKSVSSFKVTDVCSVDSVHVDRDGQFDNAAEASGVDNLCTVSSGDSDRPKTLSTASLECVECNADTTEQAVSCAHPSGLECFNVKNSTVQDSRSKPSTLFEKAYVGGQKVVFEQHVKFGGGQPKFKGFSMAYKKTPEHFTVQDFPTLPSESDAHPVQDEDRKEKQGQTSMKDLSSFLLTDGRPDSVEDSPCPSDSLSAPDAGVRDIVAQDDDLSDLPTVVISNMPRELTNEEETEFLELLQFYGTVLSFQLVHSDSSTTARIKMDNEEAADLAMSCFHENDSFFSGHTIEARIEAGEPHGD